MLTDTEAAPAASRKTNRLAGFSGKAAWIRFRENTKRLAASDQRGAIAIRGGLWTAAGYVATQLLRTATTVVLAGYFLGPEAFGVVGLVSVFLAGLSMFSELGIVASIVQDPRGDDPRFIDTAFSIQAIRGVGIWAVSMLCAYPLALFYDQPQIMPLLAVAGSSEVMRGLTSTSTWLMVRHVRLRNITLLTIGAEVIGCGVSIVWALIAPSAWALIGRTMVSAAVYALGSHIIADRRVRFRWDSSAATGILRFGSWISLSTAAHFVGSQGERLILGKSISPAELGCFSVAVMISSAPAAGISQLVNQIFLPMMSARVRSSRGEAIRDFLRTRRIFVGFAFLSGLGFLACAKPFVALLLSPKYAMTGWMLQILGIRAALDIFAAPATSVILAHGQSKYSAGANVLRVSCMISGVWIALLLFGMREAIIALLIAQAVSYIPLILGLKQLLPEVAGAEGRWYGSLLLSLALAAILFVRF